MEGTLEQRNDLTTLRKIYDLLEVIQTKFTMQTEIGINAKEEINQVIEHFIKPYLIETGKEIKNDTSSDKK